MFYYTKYNIENEKIGLVVFLMLKLRSRATIAAKNMNRWAQNIQWQNIGGQ
jgi:hypothetical protein